MTHGKTFLKRREKKRKEEDIKEHEDSYCSKEQVNHQNKKGDLRNENKQALGI